MEEVKIDDKDTEEMTKLIEREIGLKDMIDNILDDLGRRHGQVLRDKKNWWFKTYEKYKLDGKADYVFYEKEKVVRRKDG